MRFAKNQNGRVGWCCVSCSAVPCSALCTAPHMQYDREISLHIASGSGWSEAFKGAARGLLTFDPVEGLLLVAVSAF